MNEDKIIESDPEIASPRREDRKTDLQGWDRAQSETAAREEGIELTDDHWEVVAFLQKYYLEHDQPESAREVAEAMRQAFDAQGGERYLRKLFPEGPVTQGSRIAGLTPPPYNQDESFGTAF